MRNDHLIEYAAKGAIALIRSSFFRFLFCSVLLITISSPPLTAQTYDNIWVRMAIIQLENKAQADSVHQEILAGKDFYLMAMEHSRAMNAQDGGEIGWDALTSYPGMEEYIEAIPVGGISDVIEATDGIFILKKLEQGTRQLAEEWTRRYEQAISLFQQGNIYLNTGQHAQAIRYYRAVLPEYQYLLGAGHEKVSLVYDCLGFCYRQIGDFESAEYYHLEELKIRTAILGADHPYTATTLDNLGSVYREMGKYDLAIANHKKALDIRLEKLGVYSDRTSTSAHNLGLAYQRNGDWLKAEKVYEQALAIKKNIFPDDDPVVANTLNALATVYVETGRYSSADSLYDKAFMSYFNDALTREFFPSMFPGKKPDIAPVYHNKGLLALKLGHFAEAEEMLLEALKINETDLGKDHLLVAQVLNTLGGLYTEQGLYPAAESIHQRAIDIRMKKLGPTHPETIRSLSNLAATYIRQEKKYAQAESVLVQSVDVLQQSLGLKHFSSILPLQTLAGLYNNQGRYEKATGLIKQVLALQQMYYGKKNPQVATTLNNLAFTYLTRGKLDSAAVILKQAVDLWRNVYGAKHPVLAQMYYNLSLVEAERSKMARAADYFRMASKIEADFFEETLAHSSDVEKGSFMLSRERNQDFMISLAIQHSSKNNALNTLAFDMVNQRQALTFASSAQQQSYFNETQNTETQKQFEEINMLSRAIAHLTFAGPGNQEPAEFQQRMKELYQRRLYLEDKLTRESGYIVIKQRISYPSTAEITDNLPDSSALISFQKYINLSLGQGEQQIAEVRYMAFCLVNSETTEIEIVDLGSAEQIDTLIDQARAETKLTSRLGVLQQMQGANRLAQTTNKLYSKLIKPLHPLLGPIRSLYIVTDGKLNLLPLEILTDDDQQYLVESYRFQYLGGVRDLLANNSSPSDGKMYIFANPDFNAGQPAKPDPVFTSLPATLSEADSIRKIMGLPASQIFTQEKATEKYLFNLEKPRYLHIASHGFFMESPSDIEQLATPAACYTFLGKQKYEMGLFTNILLCSAIALSGANQLADVAGDSLGFDGNVTAYEISGLDLRNTELVVLSACETGMGVVQHGEGVYGLSRSFQLAGAKSVLMSLWKVPSRETTELMVSFYRHLSNGMSKFQALQSAKIKIIERQRKDQGFTHPFYWGSFKLSGIPEAG